MADTQSAGPTAVWPSLRYTDPQAAIRFLVDAFGFEEAAVYPDESGDIVHAELRWPAGGGVMLGAARPDSVLAAVPPDTGSIYIVTDAPDALFERAVTAGAAVVRELRDEDYGSRGFTVRDPAGVHWSFGTYAGT
jgi:uncharacterized glyoxalase superfamily protein PhnB